MKIIVDAFGGDNAPVEIMKGCAMAVENLGVEIILVGNEPDIKTAAVKNSISLNYMEILQADEVMDIHEEPTEITKSKKNTSIAVGLKALAEGKGDAFVCAGSTGALIVGATLIVKRIKGIKRPALAPILPSEKNKFMLLDAGANNECRPEMLAQFALMGSVYMRKVMNVSKPVVKLLNVGSEDTKGRDLEKNTYRILKTSNLNFKGNIEARELPEGNADVVVADGFTGNIALKLYEGMGSFFGRTLKSFFKGIGLLSALFIKGKITDFKKLMDYKEVGGAVLLGVSKPVIKAHGSSDAKAFYNAIRQAKNCVDGKMIETISSELESLDVK
jgi:glycerol-3-phosphate acyltransferase PlsX